MKTIAATDAKAKFAALLDAVERGETVVITRHGRPIARLAPERGEKNRAEEIARAQKAVAELRAFRKTLPKGLTLDELLSWRHAGHKY